MAQRPEAEKRQYEEARVRAVEIGEWAVQFQKQLDQAITMAVNSWVNCHGHPGFRIEPPLHGNVPRNCLSKAKKIMRETLDRRVDIALDIRKAWSIAEGPIERLCQTSSVENAYPLEGYFRNAVWRSLSRRCRCVVSSTKDGTSPSFLIMRRNKPWQKSIGNVRVGNDPNFKFEHDEAWSEDERRAPQLLGEDQNQSNSVPLLLTGGFETNRHRH